MKKIIITMLLILPMAVSAQKFGHINTQEVFAQMPEVAQVRLKMDTIQSQYENQLASMNEEIQKKMQDYQAQEATMADAIKQIRQQELQEMNQRIQLFYQTAEQDIQKKQQEKLQMLLVFLLHLFLYSWLVAQWDLENWYLPKKV